MKNFMVIAAILILSYFMVTSAVRFFDAFTYSTRDLFSAPVTIERMPALKIDLGGNNMPVPYNPNRYTDSYMQKFYDREYDGGR